MPMPKSLKSRKCKAASNTVGIYKYIYKHESSAGNQPDSDARLNEAMTSAVIPSHMPEAICSKKLKSIRADHEEISEQYIADASCSQNLLEMPFEKDYWSCLSDEIMLNIFKWLPRRSLVICARVCKRWKNLCYDESLWRQIDLGRQWLSPGTLGIVLHRGVVVLRLAMAEIKHPIFYPPSAVVNRFSRLQYLDLSMAVISPNDLTTVFSACSHLKNVSLENCAVNDDLCRHLSLNSSLEVLNMSMCHGLTPLAVSEISEGCLELKSWNLAWTKLNADSVAVLSQKIPTSMKKLNISGCSELTDESTEYLFKLPFFILVEYNFAFALIVDRCPMLLELDVSDNNAITSESLKLIIDKLHNLEHLWLCRCSRISPVTFVNLGQMKSLKKLAIFYNVTEEALKFLARSMPSVQINLQRLSTVARPTTGMRRTSIWGLRVRE